MSEKEWQELRLLKCTAIKPFKEKENKVNPVAIYSAGLLYGALLHCTPGTLLRLAFLPMK